MERDRAHRCKRYNTMMNLESLAWFQDRDIPEWLLVEVFIRLPVKIVFRFKLVSKQWLSIISHPSFARMYISRASYKQQPWTFLTNNMYVDGSDLSDVLEHGLLENSYSSPDLEIPSVRVLPFPRTQHPENILYKVFGVSNGLVLYGPGTLLMSSQPRDDDNHFESCYSICNPMTGQWISLPPLSRLFRVAVTGFLTIVENDVLANFRVVRLDASRGTKDIINIEIFVSEIGGWKDINVCIDPKIELISSKTPITLDGILHWMTYRHGLLALDPDRPLPDCLRIIPFPTDIMSDNRVTSIPDLCDVQNQRKLRYFKVFNKYTKPIGFSGFGVWILNDYESGVWCLQHKVGIEDISCDAIFYGQISIPTPMSFHPFDPDVVYLGYKGAIVSYNIKRRKLEAHGDPYVGVSSYKKIIESWMVGWRWTVSYVIPPWPISITTPRINVQKASMDSPSLDLLLD